MSKLTTTYELSCLESERENELARDAALKDIQDGLEKLDPYSYQIVARLMKSVKDDINGTQVNTKLCS